MKEARGREAPGWTGAWGDERGRQLEVLGRPLGEADDLRVGICDRSSKRVNQTPRGGGEREEQDGWLPRGFQVKASL
jgi:hypothetical protein